jgi:ribosomal protein S27E
LIRTFSNYTVYPAAHGGESYECLDCGNAKHAEHKAQIAQLSCQVCGRRNPANYSYKSEPNGQISALTCSDCNRKAAAKPRLSQAAAQGHPSAILLSDIWRMVAAQPQMSVSELVGYSESEYYSIYIDKLPSPGAWRKPKQRTLYVQARENAVIGSYVDQRFRQVPVFSIEVSPTAAENVALRVAMYMSS